MTLKYILSRKPRDRRTVFTIDPAATVREAIEVFCRHRVGALVVTDDQRRPLGIITHRDILRQIHERPNAYDDVRVEDFMTRDPVVGYIDDDAEDALAVMSSRRIRHLPVIEGNRVAGLVTAGDILRELFQRDEIRMRRMSDFISGSHGLRVF